MASERQIEANRKNASKSTGPKTAQGKAISRVNALKHGATSGQRLFLEGEDPSEFDRLREEYFEDYAPLGLRQTQLVEALVDLDWRSRRIPMLEDGMLASCGFGARVVNAATSNTVAGDKVERLPDYAGAIEVMGKSASLKGRLDRQRRALVGQLEELQARRSGRIPHRGSAPPRQRRPDPCVTKPAVPSTRASDAIAKKARAAPQGAQLVMDLEPVD